MNEWRKKERKREGVSSLWKYTFSGTWGLPARQNRENSRRELGQQEGPGCS